MLVLIGILVESTRAIAIVVRVISLTTQFYTLYVLFQFYKLPLSAFEISRLAPHNVQIIVISNPENIPLKELIKLPKDYNLLKASYTVGNTAVYVPDQSQGPEDQI